MQNVNYQISISIGLSLLHDNSTDLVHKEIGIHEYSTLRLNETNVTGNYFTLKQPNGNVTVAN